MIYATYSDFAARYATRLSEAEVNSHYLPFASARLDGRLAPYFTVPFSLNNQTARDLTLDLAYLLVLQRSRDEADLAVMQRSLETRLAALANGEQAMVTTSGETILAQGARPVVWSTTARYRTVFDLRDAPLQEVDPQRLEEEG
jgi:hypothetical protein